MHMSELRSFIAIYLFLVITSSFFRFDQNEIDILNPRSKMKLIGVFAFSK